MRKWLILAVLLAVPVSASEIGGSAEQTSLAAVNSPHLPISKVIEPKIEIIADIACSCVRTVIAEGLAIELKDAKDLIPNSEPLIGGGVLFYYPKTDTHHVAYIQAFTDEGMFVKEGNFKKCEISERLVYWNDPFIIGFIKA